MPEPIDPNLIGRLKIAYGKYQHVLALYKHTKESLKYQRDQLESTQETLNGIVHDIANPPPLFTGAGEEKGG